MLRSKGWKVAAVLLFGASCLVAQQLGAAASDQGVGRVSVIQGDVTTQRGDSGDWIASAINAPVVTGDKIASGAQGRAELQLDFADVLRLDANAMANFANLSAAQLQVQVGQGLVDFAVWRGATADAEIDTPNLAIHPHGPGNYRIEVQGPDMSVVTVRGGDATITTPKGSTDVHAGQSITVQGTDDPQYQIGEAAPRDQFDQWNQNRDNSLQNARSRSSANGYYTGISDLDGYGHWMLVPGYGQVWAPNNMDAAWTPYSAGRWVWEPYYGWTWVSTEAWGWAPYHYGRWFLYDAGWVWWPGPVTPVYRPVWAPAYVAFFGFNAGGVSVDVGFGSMGWLPIGPADPFRPWYARPGVTVVDVTVIEPLAPRARYPVFYSNVERIQTDPRIARAVVVVDSNHFGQGVVVRENVSVTDIRAARPVEGAVSVVPTRESLKVSERVVNTEALPRAATAPALRFYGTRPVAAGPPSFEQQRAQVQQRITGVAAPAARASQPVANGRGPASAWHTFGDSGATAPAGRAAPASPAVEGRGNSPPASETGRAPAPAANPSAEHPAATPAQKDGNWHAFTPAPASKTPPAKDNKKEPPPKPDDTKKSGGGGYR